MLDPAPVPHTPWSPRRIVLVTRDNDAVAAYLLARRPALTFRTRTLETVTAEDLAWADVYVGAHWPVQGDLGAVRWVHAPFAGVEALIHARPWPADTLLTRTVGHFGVRIGEYCVARALAVCQALPALLRAQQAHQWTPQSLRMLRGDRVVVVGTGAVGQGIGQAFGALGCHVEGVSRTGCARSPFAAMWPAHRLREAVAEAPWVVLALPFTPATRGLVGADVLANCRDAFLINVGRGATVDEAALVEALQQGTLRGAALDVFETEPLPPDSPLWTLPNVLLSPHIAAWTMPEEVGAGFLEALDALETGRRPSLAVDTELGY